MIHYAVIEIFRDLIHAHRDRIASYEKASQRLKPQESGLFQTFTDIIKESQQCISELTTETAAYDSVADNNDKPGKIYTFWLAQVTAELSPTHSLLDACERDEDALLGAYTNALQDREAFEDHHLVLLATQQQIVKQTHDLIRNKRNTYHQLVKNNQII